MRQSELELSVVEFSGVGRGGKHTMTKAIAARREGIAVDETGLDYRTVTKVLIMDQAIEPGMSESVINERIASKGSGWLVDALVRKNELIAESGKESLYTAQVDDLVSLVSPVLCVRTAVKAGFQRRVEQVRDNDDYQFLLVDGRNLAPVVEGVRGARLRARVFVDCNPYEAAWRQVEAADLCISQPEGIDFYANALASVKARNERDQNRAVDPVRPDEESRRVDYWTDTWLPDDTIALISQRGGDVDRLGIREFAGKFNEGGGLPFWYAPEPMAARDAVFDNKQLYIDTSPFRSVGSGPDQSIAALQEAAVGIYDEIQASMLVH